MLTSSARKVAGKLVSLLVG